MTSTVIYDGDLRTVARHVHSGNTIETDAPLDNQGQAARFSPSDLVATALGSCMMTIMGIKARDLKIDLRGTRIDIKKSMATDPRRISAIALNFTLPQSLQVSEKERVIFEHAARTCPVIYSINPEIEVEIKFNWETPQLINRISG